MQAIKFLHATKADGKMGQVYSMSNVLRA